MLCPIALKWDNFSRTAGTTVGRFSTSHNRTGTPLMALKGLSLVDIDLLKMPWLFERFGTLSRRGNVLIKGVGYLSPKSSG
jgi:hypothetical protein